MSVAASRPPAPVVAPAPVPVPTPADREPASHPFAEMLRQNRGVERPAVEAAKPGDRRHRRGDPSPSPAPSRPPASDDEACRRTTARRRAMPGGRVPAPARRPRAARHAPTGPAERPDARAPSGAPSATRRTTIARRPTPSSVAANPALRRAARGRPTRRSRAPRRLGRAPLAAGRRAPSATPTPAPRPPRPRPSNPAPTRAASLPAAATPPPAPTPAAAPRALATATRRRRRHRSRRSLPTPRPRIGRRGRDGLGRSAALPPADRDRRARAAGAGRADDALAPQAATLPVPVDSPEFAAAFGVQVSVFVREGVQQAELHLNPAETGPVSIAITLEGSQARVEFGADLAATRQAIENGLPALASALRDAGFTLAGGGVAQHSRSGGGGQGGDDAAGRGRPDRRAVRGGEAIAARPCSARAIAWPPAASISTPEPSLRGGPFCAAKAGLIAASPPAPVSIISLKTAPSLPSSAAGATPRRTIDARRDRRYRRRR